MRQRGEQVGGEGGETAVGGLGEGGEEGESAGLGREEEVVEGGAEIVGGGIHSGGRRRRSRRRRKGESEGFVGGGRAGQEGHGGREVAGVEGVQVQQALAGEGFGVFGVELQEVQVGVCVDEGDEERFAAGEEVAREDFDGFGRFGEEAQLVGLFGVAGEPGAFDGVAHDAETGALEFSGDADVALHVHECYGE